MATDADGFPLLFGPDDRPLPKDIFSTPIDVGPLSPMRAFLPNRSIPLDYAYPLAFNRILIPRTETPGEVPFRRLRFFAAWVDLVRIAIEYCKDRFRATPVRFVPAGGERSAAAYRNAQNQIEAAKDFWRMPDRINGQDFASWVALLLEEVYVTDAVRVYKHRTNDGRIHSLRHIDGETLKPVIDSWGTIIGWQQNIRGLPWADYPDVDFISRCYSPRTGDVYGTSHVEDVLTTIDTAFRKQGFDLMRFTESQLPRGFITTPDEWGPEQVEKMQKYWDSEMSGDMKRQNRVRFLPGGNLGYVPVLPLQFDAPMEEMLVSRICARWSINRSIFLSTTNRASASEVSEELTDPGIRAVQVYVGGIINEFNRTEMGWDAIEASWLGAKDRDKLAVARERQAYVDMGALLASEVRAELGYDPLPGSDAEGMRLDVHELERYFLETPIITRDEIRVGLNLPPLGGPEGEELVAIGAELASAEEDAPNAEDDLPGLPEPGTAGDVSGEGNPEAEGEAAEAGNPGGADSPHAAADASPAVAGKRIARAAAQNALDHVKRHFTSRGRETLIGIDLRKILRYEVRALAVAVPAFIRKVERRERRERRLMKAATVVQAEEGAGPHPNPAHPSRKSSKHLTATYAKKLAAIIEHGAKNYLAHAKPHAIASALAAFDAGSTKDFEIPGGVAAAHIFEAHIVPPLKKLWFAASRDADHEVARLGKTIDGRLRKGGAVTLSTDWSDVGAADYAEEHAADLVVDIEDATREGVRRTIERALRDGLSREELEDALTDSGLFTETRAQLIARTEVAYARNGSQTDSWTALGVESVFVFDGTDCDEECAAADGSIWDIDFASDNLLEHPNCERAFSPAGNFEVPED